MRLRTAWNWIEIVATVLFGAGLVIASACMICGMIHGHDFRIPN